MVNETKILWSEPVPPRWERLPPWCQALPPRCQPLRPRWKRLPPGWVSVPPWWERVSLWCLPLPPRHERERPKRLRQRPQPDPSGILISPGQPARGRKEWERALAGLPLTCSGQDRPGLGHLVALGLFALNPERLLDLLLGRVAQLTQDLAQGLALSPLAVELFSSRRVQLHPRWKHFAESSCLLEKSLQNPAIIILPTLTIRLSSESYSKKRT